MTSDKEAAKNSWKQGRLCRCYIKTLLPDFQMVRQQNGR